MPFEQKITIRALVPGLCDDWLGFFDGDAFRDNPHWASCYCYFNFAPHDVEDWETRTAVQNRAASEDLIQRGEMHGYLAYVDGKPAGWCNANLHARFTTLDDAAIDREHTGAIVCFIVAKPYRGQGVARRLLEAACAGFEAQGLETVEAYPRKEAASEAGNYHGPLSMYLSAGFEPIREEDGVVVVRKRLAGG